MTMNSKKTIPASLSAIALAMGVIFSATAIAATAQVQSSTQVQAVVTQPDSGIDTATSADTHLETGTSSTGVSNAQSGIEIKELAHAQGVATLMSAQGAQVAALHSADISTPDVKTPDTMEAPDVDTPKVHTPDIETPDVRTPEVETPEVNTPEVNAPSVSTPEIQVPEVHAPDVQVPEVHTPDVQVPEVHAPEVHVPEVQDH
ncbi:hypothetical protein [Halothiobacillus sp.]|uniref:hypothetical protein n=1 Tax=Halothiobacillus sp. TaxID=1891311 RepID=UPI002AD24542|nr:hypothetical protein [Halothiobacillus sp.]